MDLTRVKDDDAEILDDRCYFPVVNVDMTLADKYADALPMLKQVTGTTTATTTATTTTTTTTSTTTSTSPAPSPQAYRVVARSRSSTGVHQMDQGGDGGEGDGTSFVEAGGLSCARRGVGVEDDAGTRRAPRAPAVHPAHRNSLTARPSPSGAQTLAPVLELMLPSASAAPRRARATAVAWAAAQGVGGAGEATMGSAQKVGVLCAHLRSLVLQVTG